MSAAVQPRASCVFLDLILFICGIVLQHTQGRDAVLRHIHGQDTVLQHTQGRDTVFRLTHDRGLVIRHIRIGTQFYDIPIYGRSFTKCPESGSSFTIYTGRDAVLRLPKAGMQF